MSDPKTTALAVSLAITKGDWNAVEALLAADFAYVGDGRPLNRAQYIAFMRDVLSTAMREMEMTFPRVVTEGDLVAVEYTNAMTHVGPFAGIPATGKRVLATGHFIRQVRDGQVVAEWQTTNAVGLLAQLTGR
jgi:steroid delta-isomerase-like uncharacterized protein